MEKSKQGKMVGAAVVLGLSVGIGVDQALAAEATISSDKDVIVGPYNRGAAQTPGVFKFAVDPSKPGAQTGSDGAIQKQGSPGSQFVAPGDVAGMKGGPAAEPNNYKLSDVIISSAKDDTPPDEASKPGGKTHAKPRNNARKRAPN